VSLSGLGRETLELDELCRRRATEITVRLSADHSFPLEGTRDIGSPPLALASFFLAALLTTLSKNSCLHLECLTCSTLKLTRFSMYRPLTTL
jgi:hypothetical protein